MWGEPALPHDHSLPPFLPTPSSVLPGSETSRLHVQAPDPLCQQPPLGRPWPLEGTNEWSSGEQMDKSNASPWDLGVDREFQNPG